MSFIDSINSYVSGEPIVALMSPAISKRSMSMRLEKRREICETYGNGSYNYCPEGYYCVGSSYCKKKTSYVWIAGVAAVVVIIIVLAIVRRCRARRSMSAQQPVVTSTVITGQETLSPQYQQASYPAGGFAPPPGDPNMAYQPYQPTYAQPPPGSPYNAPYPPTSDSPMAYPPQAAYQPAGSPVPSAYPAPAGTPATAYSSPAYSPAGQPQYVTPAPYPVPQGEAANYAPPKH